MGPRKDSKDLPGEIEIPARDAGRHEEDIFCRDTKAKEGRKEGETKAPFSGNEHGWLRRERRVGEDTFDRAEDQTWNPIRGREKRSD